MRRLFLIAVLIPVTFAANTLAQRTAVSKDSITVQACHITFNVPPTLKRNRTEGVDSCIAEFENRKMLLSIDYGWYSGPAKKSDITVGFKEQSFSVGGKTGTLATYVDNSLYARNHPERKYVAHLYVVVKPDIRNPQMTTSLMMTVSGRSAKEILIADRIFRSVRFD